MQQTYFLKNYHFESLIYCLEVKNKMLKIILCFIYKQFSQEHSKLLHAVMVEYESLGNFEKLSHT